jgi:methionyl-tRNA formyltransferase
MAMRLVFLGTGEFAVPALRALVGAGRHVGAAISQPDRPAGRGRDVRPTAVRAAADALGIPHLQTEDINALPPVELFGDAELGVVAAFGQKLGPALLAALPRGLVNLHGALLPKYRGAAPIQRAVMAGERTTGVTVFQLNERWDAGAIWAARETLIGETETADELHDRLALIGAELIVETLAQLERGAILHPVVQDPAQATRAPKLNKAEGYVDWSQPARLVAARVNGLWSWPAAACTYVSRSGRRERVLLARACVADPEGQPPTARAGDPCSPALGAFTDDLSVQAGFGRVRLLEVRPAGGRLMPFEAFANGRQVAPPDRLAPPEAP